MAFNPAPKSFFGPAYELTSGAIKLPTASNTTGIALSATFTKGSSIDLLFSVAHGLRVGERVRLVAGTGALPTPLAEATDYWVYSGENSVFVTLAATKGGEEIFVTAAGGSNHTMLAMEALHEVTSAEAHATTGDYRKVNYGINEMQYQCWLATALDDRPEKMTMSRSSSTDDVTGLTTRFYSFSYVTEPSGIEVVAE